jgi:hypothetical protein
MRGGRRSSSDSTVYDASTAAFRREILPAWRLLWLGERRGIGEEEELNSRGTIVVAVLVSEVKGEINGDGRFPVKE